MRWFDEGVDFKTALLADAELLRTLSPEEISACFSPEHHMKHIDDIFVRVFGRSV
jgi:adenylosuccinate lyase